MKTVWANSPGENWIVDRLVADFRDGNRDVWVDDPLKADVVWLLADFAWRHVPYHFLRTKRVLSSIHHIVPQKFDRDVEIDFAQRDSITAIYHVPNEHTARDVRRHTDRPIVVIPFWANDNIWRPSSHTKEELRSKHGIPLDAFVLGSFQRDTEGAGIPRGVFMPKLEKGPDLFVEAVRSYAEKSERPVHVILAGWRRQYVMRQLDELGLSYTYFELPPQPTLVELYQCLDLYPVTARYEGGPQAFVEAGCLGVPVVTRDVGIARAVMPPESISDDVIDARPAVPNVEGLKLPQGFTPFRSLLENV